MTSTSASSSANLFRRLTWQATVPLCIRLADGTPGALDGGVYYMQASRHTYLPLLLPEIRENLVAIALSDAELEKTDEREWWFEEEPRRNGGDHVGDEGEGGLEQQGPIKWHHPLDLIQLLSLISTPLSPATTATTASSSSLPSTSETTRPPLLRLILHLSNPPHDRLFLPSPFPYPSPSVPSSTPAPSSDLPPHSALSAPPSSLNPPNSASVIALAETARSSWLNSTKSADFVRFRSTARVTGLRRVEIEAAWEALGGLAPPAGASGTAGAGAGTGAGAGGAIGGATGARGEWEPFGRLVGKVWPLPGPAFAVTPGTTGAGDGTSRPPSTDPAPAHAPTGTGGGKQPDSAYTVRALPVRVYLPDGAPVTQELVTPLQADGKPTTLLSYLHTHLPLLFPVGAPPLNPVVPAFTTSGNDTAAPGIDFKNPYPLAVPLIQGVEVPPDAELAWLCACVCGVDGWLRVGVRLRAE